MALTFLSTYKITLTPLSPIHVGCDDTFEPTNFVIDPKRRFLYGFEPSRTELTSTERTALLSLAKVGDPYKIHHYYESNLDVFRPWASSVVPIGRKLIREYRNRFSSGAGQKGKKLDIFRMSWTLVNGRSEPYIPGSSLKGAIVTALQNRLNQTQAVRRGDAQALLGGDISKSPMRFLRVGDCHGESIRTRIFNIKRSVKKDHSDEKINLQVEAVLPGQYRAFTGEITLLPGQNLNKIPNVYASPEAVMKDLHSFAYERWLDNKDIYEYHAPEWESGISKLLESMRPLFESGHAALVRLGKHNGIESKTLHGLNEAKAATTASFIDEDEEVFNGLPCGWAICELNPSQNLNLLENWCEQNRELRLAELEGDVIADEWNRVLAERQEKLAIRASRIAQDAEMAKRRQAEEEAVAAKAAAMAAMTPERREAAELCEQLENAPGAVNSGFELYNRTKLLLEKALEWTNAEDQKELALRLQPLMKKKNMFQGKAEKVFKKQLRTLKGEA